MAFLPGASHGAGGVLHNRLAMWLDPWHTDFRNGDHQARILWSMAAGGWYGIGSGVADLRMQLPEAARDTAFAGVVAGAPSAAWWTATDTPEFLPRSSTRPDMPSSGATRS